MIIPLYNGARFISTTLDSLRAQTALAHGRIHLEVIVVDDGSTDGGVGIVDEHPLKTTVLMQQHQGVAIARNRGVAAATGEWLTFLDQDDLWHETRLERILGVLDPQRAPLVVTTELKFASTVERERLYEQEPGLAALVDAWIEEGTELGALCTSSSPVDVSGSQTEDLFTSHDLLSRTIAMSTSFFITQEHLRLLGGWSPHAASIDDWWLMANASRLEPILRVDQPTLLYRLHASATSRSTNFFYAYATSLLALRFGGHFESRSEALSSEASSIVASHLVHQILYSDEFRRVKGSRSFVWHMCHLLWPKQPWLKRFSKATARRTQLRISMSRARKDRPANQISDDSVAAS